MLRLTKQKKNLFDAIDSFTSFFDAVDLYETVKGKGIGTATIYRFLKNLELKGEIHSYSCNNRKIYSRKKESHVHYKCEKCGDVKHIKIKNADFLNDVTDGEICHFQIDITGICDSCKNK